MKALNFLFNFLILTWLANSCQSDGTEKSNLVKKLLRKRRSFLKIIPLRKQNLQNEWQDFQSKVNKLRRFESQKTETEKEKQNVVKKLLRKRRSFLEIIPLKKQNLQNEWHPNKWHPNEGLDFQSKVNKLRRVKRQSWNFGQFLPSCTNSLGKKSLTNNLVDCLGNFNLLWPIRWNFNPITAYDRLKSHYKVRTF